jgi:hypothetical protein
VGAASVIVHELKMGFNLWIVVFGIVVVLFNPIIPVHLYDKVIWMPIDIAAAIVFGMKAMLLQPVTDDGESGNNANKHNL